MRTEFSNANTESDVEQFFVLPLLTSQQLLRIPDTAILTKHSLATLEIGKGTSRKRYVPDYMVINDGIPCAVIEVKNPEEELDGALSEAQLYALEINKRFPTKVNPCSVAVATNGRQVWVANWDSANPVSKIRTERIAVGSKELQALDRTIGWDALIERSIVVRRKITPSSWTRPSEFLGENRVNLAKAGHNSLYADLEPILRRYFDPKDREMEEEIVEKAYVSTEETTRYERVFEDFLRTKVIPLGEEQQSMEVKTSRREAPAFTRRMVEASQRNQPFMQLLIGGVGSGKTTFLKRFFVHLLPDEMKETIVYCRLNFNTAPDDVSVLEQWVCEYFIDTIRENYLHVVDLGSEEGIQSVFATDLKNNRAAYAFIKKGSVESYHKRVGEDILKWMSDPQLFARSLARCIGGDRKLLLIVAFDNVDRRDRADQLKIFQVGQWFMNMTRSICIMTMRDETFEAYKDEKPLDAFLKTGNFYIRPPRFVDMVSKRLHLAISDLTRDASEVISYEVEGLGTVRYPKTAVGEYLSSVFVDLFKKRRRITTVLEGLSGRNARKSLEMFIATLTSAHFDTRDFTQSALTMGRYSIQESTLLRALMRTTYLYFTPSHGFVRNVYDFSLDMERPSHFLKSELLAFLIDNRKKPGDTRYEGYYTVGRLQDVMKRFGFVKDDVRLALDTLIRDELIMAERQTRAPVTEATAVRVRPSGYVHMKILAARLEYVSACALITPLHEEQTARTIGEKWQINDPFTDARHRGKSEAAVAFLKYLEVEQARHAGSTVGLSKEAQAGWLLLKRASDGIGFTHGNSAVETGAESEFESLFE